ncbi:universal stress protein [Thermodesulfobacteriota bacterium]
MARKILIPLDGSKLGESALHHVEKLVVGGKEVEVTLLHVFIPPMPRIESGFAVTLDIPLTEEELEPIKNKAMAYLEKAAEILRDKGLDVKCKVVIGKGGLSSAEEIIRVEDEIGAELIAMSTHGRRGLSKWAFGSVTEKVLRAGKAPVLVVRAGQSPKK